MFPSTNAVQATVSVSGGHTLQDDATGVDISLTASIPHTMAAALKGRSLIDAIDAPWAVAVTVRMVRDQQPGQNQVSMRGDVEGVPLRLPVRARPDDAEADREITAMTTGEHPRWQLVLSTALPVLAKLSRPDLLEVMSRLMVEHQLELEPYGQPGWTLRGRGSEIIVEECPSVETGGLVALLDALRGD